MELLWDQSISLASKKYICGYCGNDIASNWGYHGGNRSFNAHAFIYICHNCFHATHFDIFGNQTPGPIFGDKVTDLPKDIEGLYNEARACISCNAFTASIMCCRKLLMHIAVEKKAEENKSFKHYVEYLAGNGFVPPDGKEFVEHIKDKGNDANHEIVLMEKEDAQDLIIFLEMLLKFIYEFPALAKRKKDKK